MRKVWIRWVVSRIDQTHWPGQHLSQEHNLSGAAEKIFNKILSGDFTGPAPKNKKISYPLYFHSDAEIETYANQIGLKGKKMQRNKKIQSLFNKFKNKNPDLEINVVKALAQIRWNKQKKL